MIRQPNILFLFPDQWRWNWLGCADDDIPIRTPNLDKLATRGTRFTQCRTNSPLCAPARACLALGMRYQNCGVPDNSIDTDPTKTTVFQLLRDAGYRTATTGKNDLHKPTYWKGLDGWTQLLGRYGFTQAREHSGKYDGVMNGAQTPFCYHTSLLYSRGLMGALVEDYRRRGEEASGPTATWPSPLPRALYTDDVCGRNTCEMIAEMPTEGPWLMWANFPGPHDPFDPPRELQQRYDGVEFPIPVHPQHTLKDKPIDHQQIRRNYAAQCEGIDEWVGRILDAVEQRGELENTLVVFASDHGEMLGDHGRFTKQVPHEGSVHVPLIVAGPGVQSGIVSDALVELIDVAATLLEAAQLPVPADWDARSFAPVLQGETREHRAATHSALGDWQMVCDGRFKLVKTGDKEELWDLRNLGDEGRDVAAAHAEEVERLREELATPHRNRNQ